MGCVDFEVSVGIVVFGVVELVWVVVVVSFIIDVVLFVIFVFVFNEVGLVVWVGDKGVCLGVSFLDIYFVIV